MGIIAIIGFILIILRFFFRKTLQGFSFTSQHISISRMKKNPERATAYADLLDMPFINKKDIEDKTYQLICSRLQSLPALDNYKILYTHQIDATQLLVMTELTYDDYEVDLKGKTYDAQKKVSHDFVFRHDAVLNEMGVYSDLVTNATMKFQKQEFVKALFESKVSPPGLK